MSESTNTPRIIKFKESDLSWPYDIPKICNLMDSELVSNYNDHLNSFTDVWHKNLFRDELITRLLGNLIGRLKYEEKKSLLGIHDLGIPIYGITKCPWQVNIED